MTVISILWSLYRAPVAFDHRIVPKLLIRISAWRHLHIMSNVKEMCQIEQYMGLQYPIEYAHGFVVLCFVVVIWVKHLRLPFIDKLQGECCVAGDQYPHMLFISEYQICTNSHVLRKICEDDIILLAPFVRIWRHNTGLEQVILSYNGKMRLSMFVVIGFESWKREIACKNWYKAWLSVKNDFFVIRAAIPQWFHWWSRHSWKSLGNRLTVSYT